MVERAKFTATFSFPEASSVLSSPASAVSICSAVWLRSTTLSSVPQRERAEDLLRRVHRVLLGDGGELLEELGVLGVHRGDFRSRPSRRPRT